VAVDEAMEDTFARAIAVRAGRQPDHERLLFAIVDGLEDLKLTAPTFILRQAERVLYVGRVARQRPVPRRASASHSMMKWSPGLDGGSKGVLTAPASAVERQPNPTQRQTAARPL
jgi:hypothetical protein